MMRTGPGPRTTRGSSFSGIVGHFRAFQDAHRAAVVGRVRAARGERRHHGRAARGRHVGDGVTGEERAEEVHFPIIFTLNSIMPCSASALFSVSTSGAISASTSRCSSPPSRGTATTCDNRGSGAYWGIIGVLFHVRAGAVRRGKCSRCTRARCPCPRRSGSDAPMRARSRSTAWGSSRCQNVANASASPAHAAPGRPRRALRPLK